VKRFVWTDEVGLRGRRFASKQDIERHIANGLGAGAGAGYVRANNAGEGGLQTRKFRLLAGHLPIFSHGHLASPCRLHLPIIGRKASGVAWQSEHETPKHSLPRKATCMNLPATTPTLASPSFIALGTACLLIAGCSSLATMPDNIPDGAHSYRYQSSSNTFEYSGQWKQSMPNGTGSGRDYNLNGELTATCKGEWTTTAYSSSAKGQIFRPNGTLLFEGELLSSLVVGIGCMAGPTGTYHAPNGWKVRSDQFQMVSFVAGVGIKTNASCTLTSPQGSTWTGTCNLPAQSKYADIRYDGYAYYIPELRAYPALITFTSGGIVNFTLANGPGVMRHANGEQWDGNFDMGHLVDGPVKIIGTDGKVTQAVSVNGKPQTAPAVAAVPAAVAAPASQQAGVARQAQDCGFPGWQLLQGHCGQNGWSGEVQAMDASGAQRISGTFDNNVPKGTVTWSQTDARLTVRGSMASGAGGLGFTQAQVSVGDTPVYEGEMSGFMPNGNGICRVNGSPERCEYLQGERVDALYKTRQENDRLRHDLIAAQTPKGQKPARGSTASQDPLSQAMASAASAHGGALRTQMATGMAVTRPAPVASAPAQSSTLQGASMGSHGSSGKGSAAIGNRAEADALNESLKNMAGMSSSGSSSHAERSQQLDDIVGKLAAEGGMQVYKASYRCSEDDPLTEFNVPYKSKACAAAKENWFKVYACNDVYHMTEANQQCLAACGNAGCDEGQ